MFNDGADSSLAVCLYIDCVNARDMLIDTAH